MPALLIRASMRPYSSSTTSTICSIEAGSATAVVTASAWPPALRISSETAAAFFSLSSAMTARAPAEANDFCQNATNALAGARYDDDAILETGKDDVVWIRHCEDAKTE